MNFRFNKYISVIAILAFALPVLADETGLLRTDSNSLAPLETLNITVIDVNTTCTINVTTPTGQVQSFTGTIVDGNCIGDYKPSYLLGIYEVNAVADGNTTETDTFTVTAGDNWAYDIQITDFNVTPNYYLPQQNLTFTFNLSDSNLAILNSFAKDTADTLYGTNNGRLSILRKIVEVAADGTITARVRLYFDATGSWSNIYAGTNIKIGFYYKDGTPVPGDITLQAGTSNPGSSITNNLLQEAGYDKFTTEVIVGWAGSDRISYVDITIPPTRNLSDIIFAVEYIEYHYNTGSQDRIYIRENYIDVPYSGYVRDIGDTFSSLGRLPIYLPLMPNENGLVYYAIHSNDLPGTINLNDGTFSQNSGTYSNVWAWNGYIETDADCYVYADRWDYGSHDFAGPVTLQQDPAVGATSLDIQQFDAGGTTYFPGENLNISFNLKDSNDANVTGFTGTLTDSRWDLTGGGVFFLREVLDVSEDGSSTARLSLYFDTTGSWSNIYAGTTFELSFYDKNGLTPLTSDIALSTGFIHNDSNNLTSTIVDSNWTVTVASDFTSKDIVAYLDFDIPSTYSISDIVFAVNRILYFRNSDWGDSIIIAGKNAGESSFPKNALGQIEFVTGNNFPGWGRLPLKITMNPQKDGFVFYKLESPDVDEINLNYGTLGENTGLYNNTFKWNDYIETTAKIFPYADSWWHSSHDVGTAVTLDYNDIYREYGLVDFDIDSRGYTLDDTRQLTATVLDAFSNPVSGFILNGTIPNSNDGRLSIVTQNVITTPDGNNVTRLLVYFDTTGSWSNIYAPTTVEISVYGQDGKTGINPNIVIAEGAVDANGFIDTTLIEDAGIYDWTITVTTGFAGADRQVYLDFICPDNVSAADVVFAIKRIHYFCNTGWADEIKIRDVTVHQGDFSKNYIGQFEFTTGDKFGTLGRFPLYLPLVPGGKTIYPKMVNITDYNNTDITGSVSGSGAYTYSHHFTEAGDDFNTAMCIAQYGYFNGGSLCTDYIGLFFSGETRYLGGLDDEPVLLGTTWQKNLHDHFFVDVNYANVQYFTSDANVVITDNIATFSPLDTNDTIYNLIITAQSISDPCLTASSDPFTLYAANCMDAYDCNDVNKPAACVRYQCEYYDPINTYRPVPQGVDLSIFNEDVNISNQFPDRGETVTLCANVSNHGTAYIYDVNVFFYLDDTNSVPIGANDINVVPITYFDLPFRYETACINWTIPNDINGPHRIWVEVDGNYPLDLTDEMLSNNYAVLDFFVNDPCMNTLDPALLDGCSAQANSASSERTMSTQAESENCSIIYMRIPINVQVCENEVICGPVTGYELSYWNTIYWPSWSGYCQEFTAAGDALWAFLIAYEVSMGVFGGGAGSVLSLSDGYGILKTPYGWGAGNLPCHPAPTMFPYIKYNGVNNPGCGGMCPVSAWDCGQGYSFPKRFSSHYYNPYAYRLTGGARRITRCHTETDYMEVPYQFCYQLDGSDPPINIPFAPFPGSPGPNDNSFGPTGSAPTGLGGGPPTKFWVGPPMAPDGSSAGFECTFSSTGTTISTSASDCLQCVPVLPYNRTRLQKGWNFFSLTTEPIDPNNDPVIQLQAGWNVFAYSSPDPFLWADANVSDTNQTLTIIDAQNAGWLQSTIYYFDNKTQISRLVPDDDDSLRTNKAYWLYADQNNLTLFLPGARGSVLTNYLDVNDVNVIYGNETKSLEDAQAAGWLKAAIHYYDPFDSNYKTIPGDDQNIYPWSGYWIYSNLDGPVLAAPDSNAIATLFNNRMKTFASGFYERKDIKSKQASVFADFRKEAFASFTPGVAPDFGQNAPDFLLPDTKGQLTQLSNHKGNDLLLVFGTTSCPQCAAKVPLLNELNTESIKDGLKVIFVALGDNAHTVEEFIKETNVSFDVLVDTCGITGNRYGITNVPEAFIIDREGVVAYSTPHDGPSIWSW